MLIINLFGVPGAGKSTGAAYIFSQLKMKGINVELVPEFAKDKVWEDNKEVLKNQPYVFGKQYFRITRLEDKVDVIVTDSPILLSAFYANDPKLGKEFDKCVTNIFNSYNSLNFLITRVKPYNSKGRLQTQEESDALYSKLHQFLNNHKVQFSSIPGVKEGYDSIVKQIIDVLTKEDLS